MERIDVRVLQAQMQAGFEAVKQRLDDQDRQSTQRHAENVRRLEIIDGEVKQTNGRVTRTEEQIRTLFRAPRQARPSDPDKSYGKRELSIFLAGGGALIGAWKFIEWSVHLLQGHP